MRKLPPILNPLAHHFSLLMASLSAAQFHRKGLVFLALLLVFLLPFGEAGRGVAQNKKLDSLLTLIKTDKEDTNKVNHLNLLARQYFNIGSYDTVLILAKQALALCDVISSEVEKQTNPSTSLRVTVKKAKATAYNIIGNVYASQGNYPEALKNHFASLKIKEEIGDKKGIAASYNNIGGVYYNQGNYPNALKNHFASLQLREAILDKKGIATSYSNIGNVYNSQGNYPEALKNYFASLKIGEAIGDKDGIAASYNNIGSVYNRQGNYPDALKNYFASLKIKEEIGDKYGIADSYNNIGNVYDSQGNHPDALKNYFASLKIKEAIGDKDGIASCYINIGTTYVSTHKPKEAKAMLAKALALSQEIGSKERIKESYAGLAQADSTIGNYKAAFEHHKLYILYSDSLNNEETKKKSLQASMQYEFDKKEIAAKAEQDKQDAINAEEKQKQKIVIYAVAGLLVLVGVFAVFMYNRFRITNRHKHIIEQQKKHVDEAYTKLEEKNKEVMDSIRYAKRIQTALITSEKTIEKSLNKLMKNN